MRAALARAPILLPQQVIAARRRHARKEWLQEAMSHDACARNGAGPRVRVAHWLHHLGRRSEHRRQLAWVAGQDSKPVRMPCCRTSIAHRRPCVLTSTSFISVLVPSASSVVVAW